MSLGGAWGYCKACNRLVPIDGEGNLTAHKGHESAYNSRSQCLGSLEAPSFPPEGDVAGLWGEDGEDTAPPPDEPPEPTRRTWGRSDPFGIYYDHVPVEDRKPEDNPQALP